MQLNPVKILKYFSLFHKYLSLIMHYAYYVLYTILSLLKSVTYLIFIKIQ